MFGLKPGVRTSVAAIYIDKNTVEAVEAGTIRQSWITLYPHVSRYNLLV
jgi:hypothetical protein